MSSTAEVRSRRDDQLTPDGRMPVSRIAREIGVHSGHVWRMSVGASRSPSYDVGRKLVELHDRVTKAAPTAGIVKKG